MTSLKLKHEFLVLLALQEGDKHGYEIAQFIAEKTKGAISISYGSLYPILHHLEKTASVTATWVAVGESKEKKVYALSAKGLKQLTQEKSGLQQTLEMLALLLGRPVTC